MKEFKKYLEKLIPPEELAEKSLSWKREGRKVVTLNGSFDLLHAGHLYMLYEASQQGDLLLLALNSDASIRAYKSKERPVIPLEERLKLVAALECVDFVTWFEETDPRALLEKVVPAVHVNGAEYGEACIEAETLSRLGSRLHLVRRIPKLSTSEIIAKIKELP